MALQGFLYDMPVAKLAILGALGEDDLAQMIEAAKVIEKYEKYIEQC